MNNNQSFFKVVDGKSVPFNPVDINGNKIKFKDSVIMPDPKDDDNWSHGGFLATVVDVLEMSTQGPATVEMLTVEDSDGDFFNVEPNRVKLDMD